MDCYGLTDKGCVRQNNQDSIYFSQEDMLFMVADGMGGHVQGEVASDMAIKVVISHIKDHVFDLEDNHPEYDAKIIALLKESFRLAHRAIYDYSQTLPGNQQIMGTTLSLLLLRKNKAYIGHIGDSRIYRLRTDRLEKLTKDHTEIQVLVDEGLITEEDAENHRLSHVLTRALGVSGKDRPDLEIFDTESEDKYLVTSDGIFRILNLAAVQEVLADSCSSEEKCHILLDRALQKGSPDNLSVIIMAL